MAEENISKQRRNFKDLAGRRFGRLIVLSLHHERSNGGQARWLCRCDCGNMKVFQSGNICNGTTCSCGCFRSDRSRGLNKKHGQWKTSEFDSWCKAKKRCFNVNDQAYKDYGGRGITMCEEWRNDFAVFIRDMGPRPAGLTLERLDVNGNYEPTNCCWATYTRQNRNKRNTIRITHEGQTMPLMDWADSTGISHSLIRQRYYKGLPLFAPSRKRRLS